MPDCALCGSARPAPIAKRGLALRQAPGLLALQPMNQRSQGWGWSVIRSAPGQGWCEQQRQRLAGAPDDQAAAVADESAGQVDQGKAQRLHATHASTSRVITAFRLLARIMSHAALAPNSPLGIRPVHDRMDLLALAAASAQPPDDLVAWQRAVGDDAEQLEAGGELLGGKRQLPSVGQCRKGSRIARKR